MTDSRTSATRINVLAVGDPDARTSATRINVLAIGDPDARTSATRVSVLALDPTNKTAVGAATEAESAQPIAVVQPNPVVVPLSGERASTGYFDFANDGMVMQPDGNTETDLPHPTTSLEVRLDFAIGGLTNGRMVAAVHSDGTGNARSWHWGNQSSGSATNMRMVVRENSSDTTILQVNSYWTTSRMQYRLVYSGTTVTVYKRDPATYDLPLLSNDDWTQSGQATGVVNIDQMTDAANAAWALFRRANGLGYGQTIDLYEHQIWIDGTLESSSGYGEVDPDFTDNDFLDTQGNTWSWGSATDPTHVTGSRSKEPIETESAEPIGVKFGQTVAVGDASEAESAQPIAVDQGGPNIVPVGDASEAESAQPITPVKPIVVQIGAAVESESAQPIVADKPIVETVGPAVETETAQPIEGPETLDTDVDISFGLTVTATGETEDAPPLIGVGVVGGPSANPTTPGGTPQTGRDLYGIKIYRPNRRIIREDRNR